MRSAPPSRLLRSLARITDQASLEEVGHVLVHVGPDVALAIKPVDADVHPFDVLAGFTAPLTWSAFGIRARGRAHHLDGAGPAPAASAITFLVDRRGGEASLLRRAGVLTELTGPAVGTIPDLCRRVLGLSTPPPPRSTAELWTSTWLDRVLDTWCQPHRRRGLMSSWSQIAALHPALAPTTSADRTAEDPATLVARATAHATDWSWTHLRRSPHALHLPQGPLEPELATWMDDGFFARWTLGAFPDVLTMAGDLRELLGDPLGPQLTKVVAALLD